MDPEIFNCKLCNTIFYKRKYETKHVKCMHLNETKYQNKKSLQKYVEINIQCKEESCSEKLRSSFELSNHLKSAHILKNISSQKLTLPSKSESTDMITEENIKVYKCSNCNRRYFSKSQCNRHHSACSATGKRCFTCSICRKEFHLRIALKRHVYHDHHHDGEKELKLFVNMPRPSSSNSCRFVNCKKNSLTDGIHMFCFPKEESRCQAWVDACKNKKLIGLPAENLNKSFRICSDHFNDWCFMNSSLKNRLVHNAIPDTPDPRYKTQKIKNKPTEVSTTNAVFERSPNLFAHLLQAPGSLQNTSVENTLVDQIQRRLS